VSKAVFRHNLLEMALPIKAFRRTGILLCASIHPAGEAHGRAIFQHRPDSPVRLGAIKNCRPRKARRFGRQTKV
jgi:hypothetical protein